VQSDTSSHPASTPESHSSEVASEIQRFEPVNLAKVVAGIDGHPEGRDAAALAAAIADVMGADLMLISVHSPAIFPATPIFSWKHLHKEAERVLRDVRDELAPEARVHAETDLSAARGLHRAVRAGHGDMLVVGSSRHAPTGRLRIGKRTRQLLGYFEVPLAVAPRGLAAQPRIRFGQIGVGYDGGPEAAAALALACSIAAAAGARVRVCAVVDDRVPLLLGSAFQRLASLEWKAVIDEEISRLGTEIEAAVRLTGADVTTDVACKRPAEALLTLSEEVDLLVIGSRRWGPTARVLLGSTGEALLQNAACPVVTVPRPAA
jgi:nucleotide-binding universal stress UspA family protein